MARTGKKQGKTQGKEQPRDPVTGQFTKGKSGNPRGRPKMPEEMRAAFREASDQALEVLMSILDDPHAKDADRIRAAEIILDRGYGKPVVMEVGPAQTGNGGGVIYLPEVTPDDSEAVVVVEADDV